MQNRLSWESPSSRLVLGAVLDALVDHGYEGVTVSAIKRRAGAAAAALGPSPDIDELVITAISGIQLFTAPSPTGSLRGDLRALLRHWRTPRTAEEMAIAAVLSAAEWHAPLKAAATRALDRPLAQALGAVLNRAADRDVPPSVLQTLNRVLRGLALERFRTGSRSAMDLDLLVEFLVAGLEQGAAAGRRTGTASA